jgi:hypothetical protein
MMGLSTLKYSTTEALETYPMPALDGNGELDDLGERYHAHRESLMADEAIGLTQLYNRFHDPSDADARIGAMRATHRDIDLAVARAYGWDDLDLEHGFHEVPYLPENDRVRFTISERARIEVLRRLSELNRQRYEEEVARGLHADTEARTPRRASRVEPTQPSLDFGARPTAAAHDESPATAVLDFLRTHPGWHAKADILAATGITDGHWTAAIADLLAGGQVERQGERRGARYRLLGEAE